MIVTSSSEFILAGRGPGQMSDLHINADSSDWSRPSIKLEDMDCNLFSSISGSNIIVLTRNTNCRDKPGSFGKPLLLDFLAGHCIPDHENWALSILTTCNELSVVTQA